MQNLIQRAGIVSGLSAAITMVGFMVSQAANAQAADPVSDGFNSMESKITTYGAAIVALVLLSAALFLGIKYLRKGVSKA